MILQVIYSSLLSLYKTRASPTIPQLPIALLDQDFFSFFTAKHSSLQKPLPDMFRKVCQQLCNLPIYLYIFIYLSNNSKGSQLSRVLDEVDRGDLAVNPPQIYSKKRLQCTAAEHLECRRARSSESESLGRKNWTEHMKSNPVTSHVIVIYFFNLWPFCPFFLTTQICTSMAMLTWCPQESRPTLEAYKAMLDHKGKLWALERKNNLLTQIQ